DDLAIGPSHATNEAGHVTAGRFILMAVSLPSRHSIEERSRKSGLELRSRGQSSRQFRDCRRQFAHKSLLLRPAPRRRPTHISPPAVPPLSKSPRRRSRRFRSSSHRKNGGRRLKAAWLPALHRATGCREGLALSPHTSKRVSQSGTPSTDRLLQARSVTSASYSCPPSIIIGGAFARYASAKDRACSDIASTAFIRVGVGEAGWLR